MQTDHLEPVWNTKCTNVKFYVTEWPNIPVVSACSETVFDELFTRKYYYYLF